MTASQSVSTMAAILVPISVAILTYMSHTTTIPEGTLVLWLWALVNLILFLIWSSVIMASIQMEASAAGTAAIVITVVAGAAATVGAFIYSKLLVELLLLRIHRAATSLDE